MNISGNSLGLDTSQADQEEDEMVDPAEGTKISSQNIILFYKNKHCKIVLLLFACIEALRAEKYQEQVDAIVQSVTRHKSLVQNKS